MYELTVLVWISEVTKLLVLLILTNLIQPTGIIYKYIFDLAIIINSMINVVDKILAISLENKTCN